MPIGVYKQLGPKESLILKKEKKLSKSFLKDFLKQMLKPLLHNCRCLSYCAEVSEYVGLGAND